MQKKRSVGVVVLGVVLSLCTLPACLMTFVALISSSYPVTILNGIIDIVMRILFTASPLLFLLSTIGILALQSWARVLVLVMSLGILLLSIYGTVDAYIASAIDLFSIIMSLFILIVCLSVIFFLTRPKVKEQFNP